MSCEALINFMRKPIARQKSESVIFRDIKLLCDVGGVFWSLRDYEIMLQQVLPNLKASVAGAQVVLKGQCAASNIDLTIFSYFRVAFPCRIAYVRETFNLEST